MAEFTISCDAFTRLAAIVEHYQPSDERAELASVHIRHVNGRTIAAVTNSKVAAFEFIGITEQPNSGVLVVIDPALLRQCKIEIAFNSNLTIQTNDLLQFATAKTSFGYIHPANAAIWNTNPGNLFNEIFDLLPSKSVNKSTGAMHWYLDQVVKLATSSPSGRVFFPEHIDAEKPLILRDPVNDNWLGLFIPQMNDFDRRSQNHVSSVLPDWIK